MNHLLDLLALLTGLNALIHSRHWDFCCYEIHILMERAYGPLHDEIDKLAEQIIGLGDTGPGHPCTLLRDALRWNERWEKTVDPIERVLDAEKDLRKSLTKMVGGLKDNLAMDNLLRTIAETHATNIMLLERQADHEHEEEEDE
jgi:DNA-binding ferritin-like protein